MITISTGVWESLRFSFAFSWRLRMLGIFSLSRLAMCMVSFGSFSSSEWRQIYTLLWCLCKRHRNALGPCLWMGIAFWSARVRFPVSFTVKFGSACLKALPLSLAGEVRNFALLKKGSFTWSFVVQSAGGIAYISSVLRKQGSRGCSFLISQRTYKIPTVVRSFVK